MSRRRADARGSSQCRPKRRDDAPPPRPKPDKPIPPEAAEGIGRPLEDHEHRKRAEALRQSQERAGE